jgi:hypothetical protein
MARRVRRTVHSAKTPDDPLLLHRWDLLQKKLHTLADLLEGVPEPTREKLRHREASLFVPFIRELAAHPCAWTFWQELLPKAVPIRYEQDWPTFDADVIAVAFRYKLPLPRAWPWVISPALVDPDSDKLAVTADGPLSEPSADDFLLLPSDVIQFRAFMSFLSVTVDIREQDAPGALRSDHPLRSWRQFIGAPPPLLSLEKRRRLVTEQLTPLLQSAWTAAIETPRVLEVLEVELIPAPAAGGATPKGASKELSERLVVLTDAMRPGKAQAPVALDSSGPLKELQLTAVDILLRDYFPRTMSGTVPERGPLPDKEAAHRWAERNLAKKRYIDIARDELQAMRAANPNVGDEPPHALAESIKQQLVRLSTIGT